MVARLTNKYQREYLILQVWFYFQFTFQLHLKTNVFPVFKQEIHSFLLCHEKIYKGFYIIFILSSVWMNCLEILRGLCARSPVSLCISIDFSWEAYWFMIANFKLCCLKVALDYVEREVGK